MVRLRLHPVVGPDGGRQCFACFRRAAGSELGHGQRQPRTGAVGEDRRRRFQQRHGLLRLALTIRRQSLCELEPSTDRKKLRSRCHGLIHERDRAAELLPGSRQEQAGQAVALGHGPVVCAVSGAFEEGLACPSVRFLVAEECAKLGVAVPGVVIRGRRFQLFCPEGTGLLQPAPWGQGPGQVPGAGAIGSEWNGVPEGGDGPIRVAGVVQCSAQHDVGLTALGTAGHRRAKVADGFLRAFLQQDVAQVELIQKSSGWRCWAARRRARASSPSMPRFRMR